LEKAVKLAKIIVNAPIMSLTKKQINCIQIKTTTNDDKNPCSYHVAACIKAELE
jgi:hypothetical protein